METIIEKSIIPWKLGKELLAANIAHNGISVFGERLEILLTDERQAAQAQIIIDAHNGVDDAEQRKSTAIGAVRNIPGWATWDESQLQAWYNANLSNAQVDGVANLVDAKAMLKKQNAAILAMARMLLAVRNQTWPQLPDE